MQVFADDVAWLCRELAWSGIAIAASWADRRLDLAVHTERWPASPGSTRR
jgi:hypothetical protein